MAYPAASKPTPSFRRELCPYRSVVSAGSLARDYPDCGRPLVGGVKNTECYLAGYPSVSTTAATGSSCPASSAGCVSINIHSWLQCSIASMLGLSARPLSVSEYSTRISGSIETRRSMILSCSNSFRRSESTRSLTTASRSTNSLNRIGLSADANVIASLHA
jgi:hypothetical protein